jgi:hypothetical protein
MSKMDWIVGVLSLLLAVVIFVFADGARRWYSGIFFVILGVTMLARARFKLKSDKIRGR